MLTCNDILITVYRVEWRLLATDDWRLLETTTSIAYANKVCESAKNVGALARIVITQI